MTYFICNCIGIFHQTVLILNHFDSNLDLHKWTEWCSYVRLLWWFSLSSNHFGLSKTLMLIDIFLKWVYTATGRNDYAKTNCVKGTNGRQKTYEIFHVYCIFYSGFRCQTTVIFGITKDGSLVSNTLASWKCFTRRNLFQNGANDMSECLTFETPFWEKAQNFV